MKSYDNQYTTMTFVPYWYGKKTEQKAPVILKVCPHTTEDYKTMFSKYFDAVGMKMPELIENLDLIRDYEYQRGYEEKYTYRRRENAYTYEGLKNKSTYVPCMAGIHIGMRKGVWNSLIKENKDRRIRKEWEKSCFHS